MLDVRTSDKGSVYIYDNVILMTYVKAKREMKIPAAKVKIYADSDICNLFLKAAFMFNRNKRWDNLVGEIIKIGVDHEFHYDIGVGFKDPSIKQSDKDYDYYENNNRG